MTGRYDRIACTDGFADLQGLVPSGADLDSTYNGWVNRETWNASLWLNNDEGLYHAAREVTRPGQLWAAAKALSTFAREVWPEGVTPDGDSLAKVNWYDVAKGLRE